MGSQLGQMCAKTGVPKSFNKFERSIKDDNIDYATIIRFKEADTTLHLNPAHKILIQGGHLPFQSRETCYVGSLYNFYEFLREQIY